MDFDVIVKVEYSEYVDERDDLIRDARFIAYYKELNISATDKMEWKALDKLKNKIVKYNGLKIEDIKFLVSYENLEILKKL
ncbi:MAG: hypothetical protein LBB56_08935 [Chitinispirillales bacterium]|jgi:hypothetical protein|nr:hypothetical protein [Chitinispirillales bacterium]